MTSIVDVCNRALVMLGQKRIISLEDNVKAANTLNEIYDLTRDFVLRSYPWRCTITRVQLSAEVATPAFGFTKKYQVPGDLLRVLYVDSNYDWILEDGFILSDEATILKLAYQKRVNNPDKYDSLLINALSTRLAYELAEDLTQSNTKKNALAIEYQNVLSEAARIDSLEQSTSKGADSSWVLARL